MRFATASDCSRGLWSASASKLGRRHRFKVEAFDEADGALCSRSALHVSAIFPP